MDTKLIESLLIELLQLGAARFTPEKVLANLTLAATAAGLSLSTEGAPLQREHMQLAAALERLAADISDQYRARAQLRLGAGLDGIELCAVIEPHDSTLSLPRFVAFGSSARACLASINTEIRNHMEAPAKPKGRRVKGKLSLGSLDRQLAAALKAVA